MRNPDATGSERLLQRFRLCILSRHPLQVSTRRQSGPRYRVPFSTAGRPRSVASRRRTFFSLDRFGQLAALHDLIIYELHVGTFTREGTYKAIADHFDHLKEIGVNTIELMPISDFAGDRNWGYDCVSIYAPSRAYGKPDDLRTLVNAAHEAGLAVLLDVVYNHLGPDGNYMGAYSEDYFNGSHHTPWGAAFNLNGPEAQPVRNHFAENPPYWINEFHIDGFRLDATHAIPDDSPKHLIQEIAERVQSHGAFVICEDPRNERKLILPREQGDTDATPYGLTTSIMLFASK